MPRQTDCLPRNEIAMLFFFFFPSMHRPTPRYNDESSSMFHPLFDGGHDSAIIAQSILFLDVAVNCSIIHNVGIVVRATNHFTTAPVSPIKIEILIIRAKERTKSGGILIKNEAGPH